jgi:hypothetical protein
MINFDGEAKESCEAEQLPTRAEVPAATEESTQNYSSAHDEANGQPIECAEQSLITEEDLTPSNK